MAPFDGDMEDYKRLLLSQRGTKKEPGANRKGDDRPVAVQGPSKSQRQSATPLRNKVRDHEARIAKLEADLAKAEVNLADPKIYAAGDKPRIERLSRLVNEIKAELAREESLWMEAQEQLDEALRA